MKKSVAFLTFIAAACSNGGPTPDQQRITALEAENAQLHAQLKEARDNVTKLHAAMGHGDSADDSTSEAPATAGAVAPQPVSPQPAINLGGADSGGNSSHGSSTGGYVE